MFVFMRHGQRGDNQFPQISSQIQYDPPITTQAKQTLQNSARQLAQIFNKNQIKRFKIISSPFLRCLMTAQLFCEQMKKYNISQQPIRQIQYEISQFMRPDWFKEYPLNRLIIDNTQKQIVKKYLKQPQKWQKKQQQCQNNDKNIIFPQNYGHFSQRVNKFKKNLIYPQQNIAIVCLTHGFVVREICWRMNQIPNFSGQINFCGYVVYKNPTGNKDILLKSKL